MTDRERLGALEAERDRLKADVGALREQLQALHAAQAEAVARQERFQEEVLRRLETLENQKKVGVD